MERADAAGPPQGGEREATVAVAVDVGVDQPAGVLDRAGRRRRDRRPGRLAAPAGAEPGGLGVGGSREQPHPIAPRAPRRTRRAAEDLRAGDAIDEAAVGTPVAAFDGPPGGVGDGGGARHDVRVADGPRARIPFLAREVAAAASPRPRPRPMT
jgi:hypothetical protein